MSMLFDLRRISPEEADTLIHDSSDIFFFLHGGEPYTPPKGFFHKLFGSKKEETPQRVWKSPNEGTVLELDKNWHVLHYLFAHVPWEGPMPQASLMGGLELGDVDVGYGPARLLAPPEVDNFLTYLETFNKNEFGKDITSTELEENEIYGASVGWNEESSSDLWEYVEDLKIFFSKAKAAGESIVLYLY